MRRFALPVMVAMVLLAAACSDDTEEDVTGETATASGTPSSSASPQTAAPVVEGTLWRWANVTVIVPDDSGIIVTPGVVQQPGGAFPMRLSKLNLDDPLNSTYVLINADDGSVIERSVLAKDEVLIDSVLTSIVVGPLDPETAGWPYQEQPAPDLPRLSEAFVSYIRPSPNTGLYVGWGVADPGGLFLDIRNERSAAFVRIGTDGSLEFDTTQVVESDLPAFERWLSEVRQCGVEVEC